MGAVLSDGDAEDGDKDVAGVTEGAIGTGGGGIILERLRSSTKDGVEEEADMIASMEGEGENEKM